MYIEYVETGEKSEAKRRSIAKEICLTRECSNCKALTAPAWIGPNRGTTQIAVKWFSSGEDIACSKSCVSSINNRKASKESYIKRGEKSRETQRGRTFEQLHGNEKALELKSFISKRLSESNPRWSTLYRTEEEIEHQRELNRQRSNNPFSNSTKGKTLEELYGEEKAASIKAKLSEKSRGENNPMYGKPSPLKSGGGTKGFYRGYYFRSSMELLFMHNCWKRGIVFVSAEKNFAVEYELNGIKRTYRPDFYLPETNTVVEIKPLYMTKFANNVKKFEAAKKKFANFEVKTEKDLEWIAAEEHKELVETNCIKYIKQSNNQKTKHEKAYCN